MEAAWSLSSKLERGPAAVVVVDVAVAGFARVWCE
jgi:hypothetical protein